METILKLNQLIIEGLIIVFKGQMCILLSLFLTDLLLLFVYLDLIRKIRDGDKK